MHLKKISTLALIYIVGSGGILATWLINPDRRPIELEETKPKQIEEKMEKKFPKKTWVDPLEIFWYGHATFKIKSGEAAVYFDPYRIERDTGIDLVLITHDHFDHLDVPSIEAISDGNTMVIVPNNAVSRLPKSDFRIKTISAGQTLKHGEYEVTAVEAYNIGKPFHPKGLGVGYILTFREKKIYHAGDTDFIEEMKNFRNIDVALIPISGTFTMDEEEAAGVIKAIKPKITIPMHYGVLPETSGNPERFKELVEEAAEVRILN